MARADNDLAAGIQARQSVDLVLNSSFLYRDKQALRTPQSARRLVARVVRQGEQYSVPEVSVTDGANLTRHWRIADSLQDLRTSTLSDSITQELSSIGDVVFALIGTIKGLRPAQQEVNGLIVKTLRLDATFEKVCDVQDGVCTIKAQIPIEDLFGHVTDALGHNIVLSEDDRRAIARAYDALLDEATTEVVISLTGGATSKQTVLGRVTDSLRSHSAEYRGALDVLLRKPNDRRALNEVLRVAYNFSTDVLPLVFLFMSICDLKPLVFWCTVDSHWSLHRAFASLPWAALGRKEKLSEYRDVVSAARNHAFHHVLPFDSTIEVDLSNVDVRAERLRLFAPYGQKAGRGIHLADQALVDVLAEFSRAKERPVSVGFWERNLSVMESASDLADAMLQTLMLIQRSRPRARRK